MAAWGSGASSKVLQFSFHDLQTIWSFCFYHTGQLSEWLTSLSLHASKKSSLTSRSKGRGIFKRKATTRNIGNKQTSQQHRRQVPNHMFGPLTDHWSNPILLFHKWYKMDVSFSGNTNFVPDTDILCQLWNVARWHSDPVDEHKKGKWSRDKRGVLMEVALLRPVDFSWKHHWARRALKLLHFLLTSYIWRQKKSFLQL